MGSHEANNFAVKSKLSFCFKQEPAPLADLIRYRHLAPECEPFSSDTELKAAFFSYSD